MVIISNSNIKFFKKFILRWQCRPYYRMLSSFSIRLPCIVIKHMVFRSSHHRLLHQSISKPLFNQASSQFKPYKLLSSPSQTHPPFTNNTQATLQFLSNCSQPFRHLSVRSNRFNRRLCRSKHFSRSFNPCRPLRSFSSRRLRGL